MACSRAPTLQPAMHKEGANFDYSDCLKAQEIRLLDLKYGKGEEILHFNLQTYYLNAHPDYIALSYTWGNPKDTSPVLCDGKIIKITNNLRDALWQLRENRKRLARKHHAKKCLAQPLLLWIDAVCINQQDRKEKSVQVGLMANIYQQAYKVIVWLGLSDDSSDAIVDYLNEFGAKAEACHMDAGHEPHRKLWHDMASMTTANQWPVEADVFVENIHGRIMKIPVRPLQRLFYSISGWHDQDNLLPIAGIKQFFTRAWWGRIWVLQEVTLPKNVEYICGTKTLTRSRCSAVINAYIALWLILMNRLKREPESLTPYQFEITRNLFHHRPNVMLSSWRIYRESRFPLAALLRATCVGTINLNRHGPHHLDATDPRDKVFALLDLATDQEELEHAGIFPDYEKSFQEVYTMTMAVLLQQGHISLLSMCQPRKSPGLPSWVPDWSQSVTDMLQDVENDHITLDPRFNTSGAEPKDAEITVRTGKGGMMGITIMCQIYDEIYTAGVFSNRVDSREVPVSETFSWPTQWLLEFIRLTYFRKHHYRNFGDRLRAAARSSIGGVGFNQDGQLARVGEGRFSDAIILLGRGIIQIKNKRTACEAKLFLARQVEKTKSNAWLSNQLDSEIIGKSLGRLPFVTKNGHLVLSSEHVERGDVIALIKGAQVPFVLRRQSNECYQIVSEAYVDGIMDGEAMNVSKCSPVEIL
ncbi:heterokaryon incompatibility protein-domain-containing protein [Paraphoma chrysanthemicola]|uniref:Heterokaryon incompatibility protein-domain-containing protein n=1 Tax=Paraphoma chrysanthemicola TaxID=798071 RepID=A0A8K0R2U3_9PLEO|nr:heterokaryon incompatibility protein-domain-containing protein [Paraphoma chrysanthemicola]